MAEASGGPGTGAPAARLALKVRLLIARRRISNSSAFEGSEQLIQFTLFRLMQGLIFFVKLDPRPDDTELGDADDAAATIICALPLPTAWRVQVIVLPCCC
jgi:hypothetical protein